MKRLLIVAVMLLGLWPASAQAAGCQFVLGFAAMAAVLPEVGQCTENQLSMVSGQAIQHTTNGTLGYDARNRMSIFTPNYLPDGQPVQYLYYVPANVCDGPNWKTGWAGRSTNTPGVCFSYFTPAPAPSIDSKQLDNDCRIYGITDGLCAGTPYAQAQAQQGTLDCIKRKLDYPGWVC